MEKMLTILTAIVLAGFLLYIVVNSFLHFRMMYRRNHTMKSKILRILASLISAGFFGLVMLHGGVLEVKPNTEDEENE